MKIRLVFSIVLSGFFISACGVDSIELAECEDYPLKRTQELVNSSEFGYLKFHKASAFDALQGVGQFMMADSKFDFSASYVLDMRYQAGSQTIKEHTQGCISSSSLSVKLPLNSEQKKIIGKYGEFLAFNRVHETEVAKISQALKDSSPYMQKSRFNGYRLSYGFIDHPVRGKFFKIDVKK